MEAWVEHDSVPESALPEHARDGRTGDRVSFVEGGLLHVRAGRATYARWSDVLGVVEHAGRVHVMVPRRPPAQPWLEVDASLLGAQEGSLKRFADRLREGGGSQGYRDSVKKHRQGLTRKALKAKIVAREPVPGAMEVPSTVVLGRSYPGLGAVQALTMVGALGVSYFGIISLAAAAGAAGAGARRLEPLLMLAIYVVPIVALVGGAWSAREIGRRWRAAKDATLPRQRVLVLAPDGCIVGFQKGVRTLRWDMVGGFGVERVEPSYDEGLVVYDPDGKRIGAVDAGYLDAPLGLVVAVAQTYREAATAP